MTLETAVILPVLCVMTLLVISSFFSTFNSRYHLCRFTCIVLFDMFCNFCASKLWGNQKKSLNSHYEFTASVRDKPPAHYLLRVESFSLLSQVLQKTSQRRYESLILKAGGYKWKLVLCPGDNGNDGYGYISLYLMIVETDTLPLGWMIDANFKLFVYDQIRDKYYTFEDSSAKARRFHAMKTEWGFSRLLSHTDFMNASNGYLVGDTCVFGAEVYVENENYSGIGECLSMLKTEHEGITWNIDHFSVLREEVIDSRTFTAGGQKWSLVFYPKGDSRADESFSLFLKLNDAAFIPPEQKVCAQYTVLVKDQVNGKHCSETAANWFCGSTDCWGYANFMPLAYLKDPLKGFLVNDTLIIEVKVDVTSSFKKII